MIAKQVKGRGFAGCLNYLLGKEGAELIGGNMLGETAQELASEFSASRKMRPNLKRAVYHSSLSLAPGEKLTDSQWGRVAGSYVKQMGFEGSQYCVVRHRDKEHEHVHIVASRIRMDGSYVSESKDYQRSEAIIRGIERDHGLKQVTPSRETHHRAPSRYELDLAKQEVPSHRVSLQFLIDRNIQDQPTMGQFLERLEAHGVGVSPNRAKTGHISGVTFYRNGEAMKGSDLGRGYTWQGLQRRGVSYDHTRDAGALSRSEVQAGVEARRGIHKSLHPEKINIPKEKSGDHQARSNPGEKPSQVHFLSKLQQNLVLRIATQITQQRAFHGQVETFRTSSRSAPDHSYWGKGLKLFEDAIAKFVEQRDHERELDRLEHEKRETDKKLQKEKERQQKRDLERSKNRGRGGRDIDFHGM